MSATPLRADPRPVRRWINPGEPGWRNASVHRHRWADEHLRPGHSRRGRGYMWECPNHPEHKSGGIRGVGRSWSNTTREEALRRLHRHFRRYHDAP